MSDPPVTYPMYATASRLAAGEEYATVDQILRCSDLPQQTVHVPFWRVDGKELAIRVRALSLIERDQVQRETDTVAQHCLIWQIGCVMPRFTQAQANELQDKNAFAVEQVATFIMTLGALRQEWIEHVVTVNTAAAAASETARAERGAADDPSHRARARRMDRPPVSKVRPAARRAAADA